MEYRPLDITLISANGLKYVNNCLPMNVYALVTINGDAQTEQKIDPDHHCGSNPKWNCTVKFAVDEAAANLNLVIRLVSDRHRHGPRCLVQDRPIGEVVVSINELLASEEVVFDRNVTLQPQGTLKLRFEIGERLEYPAAGPSACPYTSLPQGADEQPPREPAGGWFRRVLFGTLASAAVDAAVEFGGGCFG